MTSGREPAGKRRRFYSRVSLRVSVSPVAIVLGCLPACGGGIPLLYPAQTLGSGEVRAGVGFSETVALGALRNEIDAAVARAARPDRSGPGQADDARGALALAATAPGLAPFAQARVGLGRRAEGGLTYTGRAVEADARESFDLSPNWAMSVGIGGSGILYGRQQDEPLPDVDLGKLHGWGADLPALIGYHSTGDLYMGWVGVRGGWEHLEIADPPTGPGAAPLAAPPVGLSATHLWCGGLLGVAVGFRHLHVAMEIEASYSTVSGDFGGAHASVSGVALAPASAVWWTF